jgi:hypothetical protein
MIRPVDKRLVLYTVMTTVLVGCGGSSHPASRPSSRHPSVAARALAAWEDAVIVYDTQLNNCRGHVYATRNVWSACMRGPRGEYARAARAAVRSFSTLKPSQVCRGTATRLRKDIVKVTATQDRIIRSLDRVINVITAGHDYHGPRLDPMLRRASRSVSRDVTDARSLRTGVITRC